MYHTKHLFDPCYKTCRDFSMTTNIRILAYSRLYNYRTINNFAKKNWQFFTTMSDQSMTKGELEKAKLELKRMYDAGVRAVLPSTIIENSVRVTGNELRVSGKTYNLTENVYLVGFGKAVMGMAATLEEKLGSHLKAGIISVPCGSKDKFWKARDTSTPHPSLGTVVDYRESSVDNQPNYDTLVTTHKIVDLVENLRKEDTLIILISGGGSALLYMPRPTIQPDMKLELCKKLQNCGAEIKELNIVRKKLSMVKGGGLARMAHPARVVALILSDIVGDPIDLIASGPTVYSQKAPEESISILKKYNLYDEIDGDVKTLLNSKESVDDQSLLNAGKEFEHVDNFIIGNNSLAIEAACNEALRTGLSPIFLRNDVVGHVEEVSKAYAKITSLLCSAWNKNIDKQTFFEVIKENSVIPLAMEKVEEMFGVFNDSVGRGIVLIGGGEPTVIVQGSGKGGRNQELAFRFSLDWLEYIRNDSRLTDFDVTFLSAGTDGQDGPTDAAGAFGYAAIGPVIHAVVKKLQKLCNAEKVAEGSKKDFATGSGENSSERKENRLQERNNFAEKDSVQTMLREAEKMMPQNVLANNDSYNFYSRFRWGKDILKTGISGTNVMDLHFVLIKKRQCGCQIDFDRAEKCPDLLDEHDLRASINDPTMYSKRDGDNEKLTELLNLKILDSSLTDNCCK